MDTRIKRKILAFTICIIFGTIVPVTIAGTGEEPNSIKERLNQAVENVKKGDRRELGIMIQFVERDKGVYITEKMLPDFISFLRDTDGQIQLLGVKGLYVLKSPGSKDAIFEYLKNKDFASLKEVVDKGDLDERRAARWEGQASMMAILLLGEIGDKSAIPLLESLREVKELQYDGAPVERALAKLGAIKSFSDVPPDSDERTIWRACDAISEIKDPKKVPELMAIVYNKNCARAIRNTALRTLGNINTDGVPEFLLSVINDPQVPASMRGTAAVIAARTGDEMFEETLLEIADPNSESRIEGLCGLALLKPDKYLKSIFMMIRDVNEPDEFRYLLAKRLVLYIPWQRKRQMLGGQKDELYSCLNTNKTDGSPHDEIRVEMWCRINELFGEEPALVLSSKSPEVTSGLRHPIGTKIRNHRLSVEEREKRIDEKIDTIVKVYKSSFGKEK